MRYFRNCEEKASNAVVGVAECGYPIAHQQALDWYNMSPFAVYSIEIVVMYPEYFNQNWIDFWNISK